MRIIGWNIRAGGGKRIDRIADQINAWCADIVVLSEYRGTPPGQQLAALLNHKGFTHQRWADPTFDHGKARNQVFIAARTPLSIMQPDGAPTEPGRWLQLRVAHAEPFYLAGLHIPNQVTGRKPAFHEGVRAMAARYAHKPMVLIGDTNSGRIDLDEENPVFNIATDAWFDALSEVGCHDAFRMRYPKRREYTWYSPNAGNGFRLDQAFLTPPLHNRLRHIEHAWVEDDTGPLSDHAAVILDLNL